MTGLPPAGHRFTILPMTNYCMSTREPKTRT